MVGTATPVTNTTSLDVFSTLRTILLNNSTLSVKFKKNDFYEFEPNMDSFSFSMLPYIVIQPPSSESDLFVADHITTMKEFTTIILLVMSWEARSTQTEDGGNYRKFADAIIKQVESEEQTLANVGYQHAVIELVSTSVDILQGRQVVSGTFELKTRGYVGR